MITVLSLLIFGEKVGPRRWLALLVVRPGFAAFNLGSLFILLSMLFCALPTSQPILPTPTRPIG